jgi:hypothetical protein
VDLSKMSLFLFLHDGLASSINTAKLLFPIQLLLGAFFFFTLSLLRGIKLAALGFIFYFMSVFFGASFFTVLFLWSGLYATGYVFSLIIAKEKSYSALNVTYGIIVLFFPTVILSLLSTSKIATYYFILSHSSLLILTCCLIFFTSIAHFVRNEHKEIATVFKLLAKWERLERSTILRNVLTFSLLFFALVIVNYSSVPLINYDDMGTHYPLQHRFANGLYPSFDVSLHVWAVSQWIFDIYYGVFEYFFPENGRNYLNLLLSLTIVAVIYQTLNKRFSQLLSLFITVVCCSTPLFALALTTSQTELISLLLLASLVSIFFSYNKNSLILILPIVAFSVAIKPSNAVLFIFPFITFIFKEYKDNGLAIVRSSRFWTSLCLSIFTTFIVYLFAYYKSGNPFFPLFNGYFKAQHFPFINFYNSLYSGNFNLSSFIGLIFDTPRYLESYNYVAGFQLLLLPLMICTSFFIVRRNASLFLLFMSVVLGGVTLFHSQQYARYLMPCIVLLPLFYIFVLDFTSWSNVHVKRGLIVLLICVGISNIYFIPNVIWYLKSWGNNFSILNYTKSRYGVELDTILSVNRFLNSLPDKKVVVYPLQKPYASNLDGKYIYINWYNTAAFTAFDGGKQSLVDYFKSQAVNYMIVCDASTKVEKDIAGEFGTLVYDANGYQVYNLFKNIHD